MDVSLLNGNLFTHRMLSSRGKPLVKPMGRINDVLIVANRNYVPVDFIVLGAS